MNPSKDESRSVSEDAAQLATQASHSSTRDEALDLAIKAAERSMQALKLARSPGEKAKLTKEIQQLLGEAERIKSSKDWNAVVRPSSLVGQPPSASTVTTDSRPKFLKEPVSTRQLPKSEQILLLKASYVNGFKFPPWTASPAPGEFELADDEDLFLDKPDLPLSELQEDVFEAWKRPAEALPPPFSRAGESNELGPTMSFSKKIDLVQDAATDCSVVASLCAGVARAERGHGQVIRSTLHPFDHQNGRPAMSNNGKYVARLNFNGCYRRVEIDDRLPTSTTSRVIHVLDRLNPGLLWPALVEKAYLKVRGGYDFPGSNSGTDLWILTGWIPEQVFLQCDDVDPDRFWRRISNGFKFGDVLITMGTGKMSSRTEKELGLAGEHDYAVLDLREVDRQRLLLIKNPWSEGTSWRGKVNAGYDVSVIAEENNEPVKSSRDLLNADEQLTPGTFWMDLDNVIQHFESIYLNWNPGLFSSRQDVHFAWDLAPSEAGSSLPRGQYASLSRHPQYTVKTQSKQSIWILLWRHFQNAVPADATPEEIEADRYGIELSGHMSLHAFSAGGHRVTLPDKAREKGWFVDSPQTLLKLEDCAPGETLTLVPMEQELPAVRHTFTISVFSSSSVALEKASSPYQHAQTLTSAWTKDTAGGNAHSPAYSTNPQFSITVPHTTNVSLLLEAINNELNVHVKLVHSKGQRIHSIRNKDIVFDSKEYRRGCCLAGFTDLEPGQYTIICSTFEPQQLGEFSLTVESNQSMHIIPLPREGAGRLRVELNPAVFQPAQSRIAAPLVAHRLVKFCAVARLFDESRNARAASTKFPSNRSLVRMSVEMGHRPDYRTLTASSDGEYSDSASGIRTGDLDLSPAMQRMDELWIVLDRMHGGADGGEERLAVELLVDQPDAISCGAWRSWDD